MIRIILSRQNMLLCICLILLFSATLSPARPDERTVLPPPVLASRYFPCSMCHNQNEIRVEKAGQREHNAIRVEKHVEDNYDCFGCHDSEDLNKLRLFNGNTIDLALSSQLCGQCHSTNYKLWLSGLHGKVMGKWNGPQKITPCTHCHDPHQPGLATQEPESPPTHPEETLRW